MRDIDPHIKNLIYFIGGRRHSGCRAMSPGPPTTRWRKEASPIRIYIKAIAFQGKIRSSLVPTPKPYRDILRFFCNSFCPRLPCATWPLSAIEDAHQGFQGESN